MKPCHAVALVVVVILQLAVAILGNPVERELQREQRRNAIDHVGEVNTAITNNYGKRHIARRSAIGHVGNFYTGEMYDYDYNSGGFVQAQSKDGVRKPGHGAIGSIDNLYVGGELVVPSVDSPSSSSATDYTISPQDALPSYSTPVKSTSTPSSNSSSKTH